MSKGLVFNKFLGRYVPEYEHVLLLEGSNGLEGDDMARPDFDGDVIEANGCVQRMQGPSVRVTIPHDADAKIAARLLRKISEWIESSPSLLVARMADRSYEVMLEEDSRKIIQDPQGMPSDDFDDACSF